jgi:tRNA(Arg) A34 adenosine deaminase TadA
MQATIDLPDWATTANQNLPANVESIEDRMRLVIEFSRLNIDHKTGGPFAAGVFEKRSGRPIVIGVNRVIPLKNSSAHAEIVTLMMAQKILNIFDLGGPGMPEYQLVINAQPCAMCCGAIPWSGIGSVVTAATGNQVESITGFDEGPVHPQWQFQYERRGIEVIENVLADQACEVLKAFVRSGAQIYNGRQRF